MFESASKILDHYIKIDDRPLWRFDIYSIYTQRGDNPEDLYYLCNVRDSWYVILETDFIDRDELEHAAREAAELFEFDGAKISHWVTKRDAAGSESQLPLDAIEDKNKRSRLVLDIEGTYLRCAVLAIATKP